ncbi:3-dehydroquinate dehydratase [Oceanobacillus iheyensis HTE831]|uniref:3-dehydroquinate dehydratase n=1 Tax=Oceanobacillus iheyensis (strain DSM 14371 / CIP 107618 / JCM 11309 / KCTC 3954 / HTE831) TaxID=221109 RepID=Q8ELI5_OCEIH|nr:type I 3-dehydroquinate dehydratase [Oceanobacillus iheyensis]BAC15198.1 3-dehydroquinate dehydratase [Oceanobacillus iheyensis HTE831]
MTADLFTNKNIPYICTPITGKSKEEIITELHSLILEEPDLIEWRLDYFDSISDTTEVLSTLKQLTSASSIPLLVTIRSEKEGGENIPLSEKEKVQLLLEVCENSSVEMVDYEVGNDCVYVKQLREASRKYNKKLILSYHNFDYTPNRQVILKRLYQMEFYGADIAKVAVMPQTKDDVLRLLELTKEANESMDIPVVTMSMGALGSLSRIVGWAYGSIITFGLGVQSSAPGQVPIANLKRMIQMMKDTIGEWK